MKKNDLISSRQERKAIYLDDAIEAIRKLPNAGIHWFVSAEAVFNALLKLPSAQTEPLTDKKKRLLQTDLITDIQNGIKATNSNDAYSCGMRNAMRWCISLIDGKEPVFENCPSSSKPLKYSGVSICCYCNTVFCNGCLYEPVENEEQ